MSAEAFSVVAALFGAALVVQTVHYLAGLLRRTVR